jgi:hypothetical protein
MKKVFLFSALAALIAVGMASTSEAKTKVQIYLGVPHYSYQVSPEYRYRQGHGWYNPDAGYDDGYDDGSASDDDSDDYDQQPVYEAPRYKPRDRYARGGISCRQAQRLVLSRGFKNVSPVECDGRVYTFSSMRHGNEALIYVNARTGAVWGG